jgi:aryl-alcohol dehydrogenase-like predicted oxidoreductase
LLVGPESVTIASAFTADGTHIIPPTPCQRGWCDGHPGSSSRCADERNRSAAADDHPEMQDFARAAGFRFLAADLETNPAILAHRYALTLDIDTLVLGVKNRQELADCVAAAEAGPLPAELVNQIDRSVNRDGN